LLTPTFAIQSNHFVVPVNPALATILTNLLRPSLRLRGSVSRRYRRFGDLRHNRCRQGGTFSLKNSLDGGGQIAQQMKPVGHLDSLRGSTGCAVGIEPAPVTADHLLAGMGLQPCREAVGTTIRQ
jgi:hypothetical protein